MASATLIDRLLHEAAQAQEIPGAVAMATTAEGVLYEGAFGRRVLPGGTAMTLDTVFSIASMTKALTATAMLQQVEQGKATLDQPAGEILPELAEPRVLAGFDAAGNPLLRPARRAITLRHLLTHTAGFGYDIWNGDLQRYARATGATAAGSGRLGPFDAPLVADPGERWEYSVAIDWVGRVVAALSGMPLDEYFERHIFAPLGMVDTGYAPGPDQAARLAGLHARAADGALLPTERPVPPARQFFAGGGGLFSTGRDYLAFLRALLAGGRLGDAVLLRPETVASMLENHIGPLAVQPLRSVNPVLSNDLEVFPGMTKKWGLSLLINTEPGPAGRSAGSGAWAGLHNTYYWLDPGRGVAGLLMTQILPFADPAVLRLFDRFEAGVYALAERPPGAPAITPPG